MMRFRNVPEPGGFRAAVRANEDHIAAEIAAGRRPDFTGRDSWGKFKKDMAPATFGKCGYCEVDVFAVDRFKGDVEHYRPKGRVDLVVLADDGTIQPDGSFDSGYHWLAYQWSNYVLTCNVCNSAHKRNFFPVRQRPAAAPTPGTEAAEDPLLLTPFGRRDPAKHLTFDHLGIVGPRKGSPYGRATIAVCGLARTPLEKKRRRTAKMVRTLLDVLANAASTVGQVDNALLMIAQLGTVDMEHCGMVRAMFSEATKLPWSHVEQRFPQPPPVFETG